MPNIICRGSGIISGLGPSRGLILERLIKLIDSLQASKVLDTLFRILKGVLMLLIMIVEMVMFVVDERRDHLVVVVKLHLKLLTVIVVSLGGRCWRCWWIQAFFFTSLHVGLMLGE